MRSIQAGSRATEQARLRMIVKGHVQGVFFRATAAERARALGITGWARNLVDGTVEIVAEGPRANLEKFAAWARIGPPAARVEDVIEEWGEFAHEFSDFQVR
jgi:acylphosphatase